MFLEELEKREKIAFLELAAMIARIDGKLSIYENSLLKKYQREMELDDYELEGLSIEEILTEFKSERSKYIVLTEIFQLIYSDGVFHDHESEFVHIIKRHFGFDASEFGTFKDWVEKIKELSVTKRER
ncbi:hypothetical protein M3610_20555 [Neobacillus sp. MER 74]|jgi:hypothetical protein|uniref:hypothetical protein n=1 Tax=Bacillaceae TaxID=186817 RepID=UPI000BF59471|nr:MULTISPECIES: hypothetical protein [Bacillaceae]MCM3117666.1 hypothetical protein [Neobacillus sp. MER 74]PFP24879.1 hypothetical protein COJ96_22910 [Bacillus sp. AFS073361]